MALPAVSVIIPCYRSGATLPACLDSLRRQTHRDFEVILVDSTPDDDSACRIAERYEGVRCVRHPQRLGAHAARNAGAGMARGEILVFTDPDMAADARWLERLLAAHGSGQTVVAGGVACVPGYWNTTVHFLKYGWWLPGGKAEERPLLASGNFSLRRTLFEECGGFPPRFWAGDTELSLMLRGKGHRLWFQPDAVTTHLDEAGAGKFLRERYERGYDHGSARILRMGWKRRQCFLRLLLTPLVPLVMLARCGWFVGRSGRLLYWLAAAPVILAGLIAWALGEARAHADGFSRSRQRCDWNRGGSGGRSCDMK